MFLTIRRPTLLEKFFDDDFFDTAVNQNFVPSVDIDDAKDRLLITADIPGVNEKDIKLEYKDGILSISGERKEEKKSSIKQERYFGSFKRSFTIGDGIDADNIKAKYKNGTLEIEIPKPEKQVPKQIPIN